VSDPEERVAIAAIHLGIQLRALAASAGDFVGLTDAALLSAGTVTPTIARETLDELERAALELCHQCESYLAVRAVATRLRDGG
jgi:hypothetical protein